MECKHSFCESFQNYNINDGTTDVMYQCKDCGKIIHIDKVDRRGNLISRTKTEDIPMEHTQDITLQITDKLNQETIEYMYDVISKDVQVNPHRYGYVNTGYKTSIYTIDRATIREALVIGFNELIKRRVNKCR